VTRAGLAALLSHWRRSPLQLFTLVAGLALATALWSGVQAINAEARASYDAAAATLGEAQFAQITRADGGPIARDTYVALRRAGWLVSPVIEGRLEGVRLIGVEPLTAPGGIGPVALDAGDDLPGFLGEGILFGRAEVLAALSGTGLRGIEAPDVAPGIALTDIGVAERLLGPGISRLIVAPAQPRDRPDLAQVAPGLVLQPPQAGSDIGRLTDSFHLNLTAFGLLSFAVGIFIVHGAIGLAVEQRRPMVRTLRALGMPLARIVTLMAAELLALALVAGALGVALGYGIAAALLPDVAATLRGLYGAEVAGTLQLRPAWWLSGLGIALAGTALAGGRALAQVARMPLLASARPRAWAMQSRRGLVMQAALAGVLLGLAGLVAALGSGLVAGFVLLGALLLGGALLLPVVLSALLATAEARARRPVAGWFWADTRQQLPGLSLALMALLLAMAANVGVSTMVGSFRLTFVGFLDQVLASELYLTAEDDAQAEALTDWLEPRVDAILPIRNVERDVAGLPAEVFGNRPHATYRDNWRFLQSAPGAWEAVDAGAGVVINEQLSRRAGLAVGDAVVLEGAAFEVLGVYGDYGNPIGQVILTEAAFERLFPGVEALRFGLRLPPDAVPALEAALRDDFGLGEGRMIDQAGIKAISMQVFERTFAVTAALNVLTLAVAGFAMLMSLLTLAAMRLPQLAPVWALGLTRADLGRAELLRALLLAALTAVLALPLGLALAWVLLAVVNVEAFGWRLPMALFPGDYARLGLFACLAALIAALWPARRLARTPPAELLKVFTNER